MVMAIRVLSVLTTAVVVEMVEKGWVKQKLK